jgi:hypothetical protein
MQMDSGVILQIPFVGLTERFIFLWDKAYPSASTNRDKRGNISENLP